MNNSIDRSLIEKYKNLEFFSKQVVEGFITGLHRSPYHGFSVEFAEHRQYNQGESTRHIDWKLFGRSDRYYTKKYEEETNLRCQIIIDTSSSMLYPTDAANNNLLNKLEFSVYAAAALSELLKKQRDAVGLTLFSKELDFFAQAKGSVAHQNRIYHKLEEVLGAKPNLKSTNIIEHLHTMAEVLHKRSLVIIFSDMLDDTTDTEKVFQALQHFRHNNHEVILFHTTYKMYEQNFEFENRPTTFVDIETNQEVKLMPAQIKEAYLEGSNKFYNDLKEKCSQFNIEFVEADISEGFDGVLSAYLIKRSKIV